MVEVLETKREYYYELSLRTRDIDSYDDDDRRPSRANAGDVMLAIGLPFRKK